MRTILIIGGSRGVGKSILDAQLALGNRVINISRTQADVSDNNLEQYSADVLVDELPTFDDKIDALFYCPGSINLKPISSLSLNDFREDLEINFIAAIKVIQHYLTQLKAADNPSVLLFSTVAVKLGMPYHSSVAASKAAVEGLVKSLGAEWAPSIRINAIALSLTDTDLASRLLRNEKMRETMEQRHPLKRILDAKEVASFANYLCSDEAKSFSGQIFEMDNGIVSFKI